MKKIADRKGNKGNSDQVENRATERLDSDVSLTVKRAASVLTGLFYKSYSAISKFAHEKHQQAKRKRDESFILERLYWDGETNDEENKGDEDSNVPPSREVEVAVDSKHSDENSALRNKHYIRANPSVIHTAREACIELVYCNAITAKESRSVTYCLHRFGEEFALHHLILIVLFNDEARKWLQKTSVYQSVFNDREKMH